MKTMWMILAAAAIVINSCAINVQVKGEFEGSITRETVTELQQNLEQIVTVMIGEEAYEGKILSVTNESVKILNGTESVEIPVSAISSVIRKGKAGSSKALLGTGLVIGGLTGGLAGEAAGQQAGINTKDKNEWRIQAASAMVGAGLGALTMTMIGQAKDKIIEVNPGMKLYTLDKAVGKHISVVEIQQHGLFSDLQLKAGEVLLKASIYKCSKEDYVIVYRTHNGETETLNWELVDAEYISAQKQKIKSGKVVKVLIED